MGGVAPTGTIPPPGSERGKLIALDAVRGAAAFVVFNQHMLEGLLPGAASAVSGTVFAGCVNGPAAVVLFFVLSGFVLTIGPLGAGRPEAVLPLVAKRWPRLAGPVVVASLGYVAAAWLGLFPPISLAPSVHGPPPPFLFWGQAVHAERAAAVLAEAACGTFLAGAARYNGVLWTMRLELIGSMVAFAAAAIALTQGPRGLRATAVVLLAVVVSVWNPWLTPFPFGMAAAAAHRRWGWRAHLPGPAAAALCLLATLLWSWDIRHAGPAWAWTNGLGADARLRVWVLAQSAAAACWLGVALYYPPLHRALSGRIGHAAGRLSFPFYLTHLLVMLSLSAWLTIALAPLPLQTPAALLVYAITLAAALLTATPLALFDVWWTRALGRLTGRDRLALGRPRSVASAHAALSHRVGGWRPRRGH